MTTRRRSTAAHFFRATTGLVALTALTLGAAAAQVPGDSARLADSLAAKAKADSAPKRSRFGRLRDMANINTAKSIVKAAACTVIPGSSAVAGAVEGIKNRDLGEAAKGAANGVTSSGCVPGLSSLVSAQGQSAAAAAGVTGVMSAAIDARAQQQVIQQQAQQMVSSVAAGVQATPTGQPTANGQQVAATQAMAAQMAKATAAVAAMPSEAPGEQSKLSGDAAVQLKKGKLVVTHLDWIRQSPVLSPAAMPAFIETMTAAARAMVQVGGEYRVDLYLDKRYTDAEAATLGPQRIAFLASVLIDRAQVATIAQMGTARKSGEPRIELVKVK